MKRFILTITLALASIIISSPTKAQDSAKSEKFNTWITILVTENITEATKAAGGEWLPAEKLSQTPRGDDEFDGFTLEHINSALIFKRDVLNRFVKENFEIINQYYETISYEDYLAMPINKIISMCVVENRVKIYVNDKNYTSNPCTEFAAMLELVGNVKTARKNAK